MFNFGQLDVFLSNWQPFSNLSGNWRGSLVTKYRDVIKNIQTHIILFVGFNYFN